MEDILLTVKELSAYLRLNEDKIMDMASNGDIPAVKVAEDWRFPKEKIDLWIEQKLPEEFAIDFESMPPALLDVPLINFIPRCGILPDLETTEKDKVLQRLTRTAHTCGCIADPGWFYTNLKEREEMVSTAQEGGIAFLHTRHRNPRNIMRPFLLIARSPEGIMWGAPDEKPTHIFCVLGLRYDALHLKILSQLARMTRKDLVKEMMAAEEEEGIIEAISGLESTCPRK